MSSVIHVRCKSKDELEIPKYATWLQMKKCETILINEIDSTLNKETDAIEALTIRNDILTLVELTREHLNHKFVSEPIFAEGKNLVKLFQSVTKEVLDKF